MVDKIHIVTLYTLILAVAPLLFWVDSRYAHAANYNKRVHNSGNNTITIYEDDDTTPRRVFDTNQDLSEITPQ